MGDGDAMDDGPGMQWGWEVAQRAGDAKAPDPIGHADQLTDPRHFYQIGCSGSVYFTSEMLGLGDSEGITKWNYHISSFNPPASARATSTHRFIRSSFGCSTYIGAVHIRKLFEQGLRMPVLRLRRSMRSGIG
jgi:hypothetical protein